MRIKYLGRTCRADTLEQLRSHDPITPRAFDARIPRDLETICSKHLEKELRQLFGHTAGISSLRMLADSGQLVTADANPQNEEKSASESHKLPTLHPTRLVEFPLISEHSPSSLMFSPNGSKVYFTSVSGQVLVADLPTLQIRRLMQRSGPAYWLATDRAERTIFSASRAADVKLWDAERRQEVFVLSGSPADFWGMQYATDASLVVTASSHGVFTFFAAPGW